MADKQVKKISVATVYGTVDTPEGLKKLADEKRIHIMSVLGQAIGVKAGTKVWPDGTSRPWEALTGTFKATNPHTKETFRGNTLFLPDVALTSVKVAMVDPESGAFRAAAFAMNIYAELAANRKAGGSVYEYTFEHALPADDKDPIARLEQQIAKNQALPAPGATPPGSKGAAKAPKG